LGEYAREVEELALSLERARRLTTQLDAGRLGLAYPPVPTTVVGPAPRYGDEFDELEFDRYGELQLLSRELSEVTNDLSSVSSQLRQLVAGFESYLAGQSRLTGEVQDKLMRLRMINLATLENRMRRTVRVAAQKSGKQADLTVEGLDVELDTSVVERLAGPLDHLLRNAVDHGVEDSDARVAAGKPPSGTVRVVAIQRGADVIVRLTDDGGGVDIERLRETAVRLAFMTEAEAHEADTDRLLKLLFEPGFSTNTSVSEISGRGVGLDVVRSSVEALKGQLSIESEPGVGTTFTIRIPTTLAISRVLFIEEQGETYAIPLGSVERVATIDATQVEQLARKPMVRLDGEPLPLVRLADPLGLPPNTAPSRIRQPLLVVRTGEESYALSLDRIIGARQVMVKPLTGMLLRVPALAGATLLGDGSVVLVLNPAAIGPGARAENRPHQVTAPAAPRRPLQVLIVDDSLSVRRVVANLVKSHGWLPQQAKDGVEALELLRHGDEKPDVILMDIEMPRMDGFELTATLRSQAEYRNIPILMLTSRAGEKHRSKAMALGATHYLVKPYQEDVLVSLIRSSADQNRQAGRVA
jgi:chemosensory pili system protein ChpA (sensor histidine kinase/response regulator)